LGTDRVFEAAIAGRSVDNGARLVQRVPVTSVVPQETSEVPRAVWLGTAMQVIGRMWGAACTFAILFLAAEGLELEGFGRLTFYLALFAWLDSLAGLGTGQVAVQRTAAHPEKTLSVLASARRVRLVAGSAGVALTAAIAFGHGEKDALWIVVASLYPVTHVLELSATVFRNRIAWGVPVRMRAIASGISLLGVAVLFRSEIGRPALYLLAIAAGSTVANFLLHFAAREHLPKASGRVEREPGIFREALPLGISALCAQTYFYVDNLFISAIRGDEELGHYNVAVRVMSWTIMLAQYTSLSILPWLRRRHFAGDLGPALSKIATPLFAAAGFAAGLIWPWTSELLELFQPGFGAAGPALKWLLGATVAIYAGSILLTAGVALGKNGAILAISAGGVVLNVAFNAWAVPAMGIEGAGMTTFATEVFVALGAAGILRRSGVAPGPAWRWLGGPVLFALGASLSALLPFH
jgi:O-antigen/teichoic acid export membrane protein